MRNADKRFMFCFSYLDLLSVEFTPVSLVPTFPSFPFVSIFIPHFEKGHFITDAESLRELES